MSKKRIAKKGMPIKEKLSKKGQGTKKSTVSTRRLAKGRKKY